MKAGFILISDILLYESMVYSHIRQLFYLLPLPPPAHVLENGE
jgi:hypothetical protein